MNSRRRLLTVALLAGTVATALAQGTDRLRSGFEDMSRDSQAMQRDDTANPGMLWVLDGEALWAAKAGTRLNTRPICRVPSSVMIG